MTPSVRRVSAIVHWFIILTLLSSILSFDFNQSPPKPNISKQYDPNFRPNHGAVSDMLNLSIDDFSVLEVDTTRMKFTADFTLRTSWTDPRLVNAVNKSTVFVKSFPNIWIPGTIILDSIALGASGASENGKSLMIKPQGEVVLNQRHVTEIRCQMSFVKLPFDRQECWIKIKSFAYPRLHLDMVWNGQVDVSRAKVFDSEFSLVSIQQSTDTEQNIQGEFRILSAIVILRRSPWKHVRATMLPTLFLTFIAYLTLFVTTEDASSLINWVPFSLGLTRTLLTLIVFIVTQIILQFYYLRSPDGTVSGLDIWMASFLGIQFLILCLNLSLLIKPIRSASNLSPDSKSKPRLQRIAKHFIVGIPIFILLFFIIYFLVYFI